MRSLKNLSLFLKNQHAEIDATRISRTPAKRHLCLSLVAPIPARRFFSSGNYIRAFARIFPLSYFSDVGACRQAALTNQGH